MKLRSQEINQGSDLDDDSLKVLIEQSPWQTMGELAVKLNTSRSAINRHLERTGKTSNLGVWVPREPREWNKVSGGSTAVTLLSRHRDELFSGQVVRGAEN